MEPGTYNAKVIDYGVATTSKNVPYILVKFLVEGPEAENKEFDWSGWLSEKALPGTIRQLKVAGFKGNTKQDLGAFVNGKASGALDESLVVPVSITNETYEGRTRLKLTWIGEGGGAKVLAGNDAMAALNAVGIACAPAAAGAGMDPAKVPF